MDSDWRDGFALTDLPPIYEEMAGYIGIPAALELGEKMGGSSIYLPKVDRLIITRRNALIKTDLARGMGYRAIAAKYKLTDQRIRQIEQEIKEDRQTDMFPVG